MIELRIKRSDFVKHGNNAFQFLVEKLNAAGFDLDRKIVRKDDFETSDIIYNQETKE